MRGLKKYPDLPCGLLRRAIRSCFDKEDLVLESLERDMLPVCRRGETPSLLVPAVTRDPLPVTEPPPDDVFGLDFLDAPDLADLLDLACFESLDRLG